MPADLTVGQFVYVIRKRIKVSPEKAIFMFVKNTLPPTGASTGKGFCPGCCRPRAWIALHGGHREGAWGGGASNAVTTATPVSPGLAKLELYTS